MILKTVTSIILSTFRTGYENIGFLFLLNLGWFFLVFSPMFIASLLQIENAVFLALSLVVVFILFGPASAVVQSSTHRLIAKEDISFAELKQTFFRIFKRSILLVSAYSLIFLILVVNLLFSYNNPIAFVRVFSGLWLYLVIFLFMMIQYAFPLLVSRDWGVIAIVKQTATLVLDNVLLSLLILVFNVILTMISFILVIPLVLVWAILIGLIQNYTLLHVVKRFN